MQIFHKAEEVLISEQGGFPYAAIGIFFSVDNYNVDFTWSEQKVIDHFFESLNWGNE